MSKEEIEEIKKELNKSVNTYTPKIRTGEQLERENYLLCFRSKSQLASMLIDAEEKIDKAIEYIKKKKINCELYGEQTFNIDELLEILKGDPNEKID